MLRAVSIDEVGHSMADDDQGSVTQWLGELKAGGRSAAEPLWYRYFERLVMLARSRLRAVHATSAVADEEDAGAERVR